MGILPLVWRGLLLGVAAVALVAELIATPPEVQAQTAAPIRLAGEPEPGPSSNAPAADYRNVGTHPLFDPTRQPWAPPPSPPPPAIPVYVPPPPPPLPPPRGYVLTGVVMSAGQHRAFLRSGNGQVLQVVEGQAVEGWQIQSIGRDRLRFVAPNATYDLGFPEPKGSARLARTVP